MVAEDIRNRVLRGELRYRDVAVLTADLPGLDSYIDLVMSEYGLPYFSDQNRSFSNNPIIDTQMALLEILDRDFTYESVFLLSRQESRRVHWWKRDLHRAVRSFWRIS